MAVFLIWWTNPVSKVVWPTQTNLRVAQESPRDKLIKGVGFSLQGGVMLEVKVERCAGIDVHKKFLMVCVMIGLAHQKPSSEVRRFGTSVPELEKLKAWLMEKGCTEAVM